MLAFYNRAHRFKFNKTEAFDSTDPEVFNRLSLEIINEFLNVEAPEISVFPISLDASNSLQIITCQTPKFALQKFIQTFRKVLSLAGIESTEDAKSCENVGDKSLLIISSGPKLDGSSFHKKNIQ